MSRKLRYCVESCKPKRPRSSHRRYLSLGSLGVRTVASRRSFTGEIQQKEVLLLLVKGICKWNWPFPLCVHRGRNTMSSRPTWFHCLSSAASNTPNCACTTEVQTSAKHKGAGPEKVNSSPHKPLHQCPLPSFPFSFLVLQTLQNAACISSTFFGTVSLKWEGYHSVWDHPTGLRFQENRSPAQMISKSRNFSLTSCLSLTKAASRVQYGERLTRTVGLWLAGLLKQAAAGTLWSTQQSGGKTSCRLEENLCKLCTHQRTSI